MVLKGQPPDQYFEPTLCELKDTLLFLQLLLCGQVKTLAVPI